MYALEVKNDQIIELQKDKLHNLDLSKFHCIQGKKRMGSDRKKDIFDLLQKDRTFISDGSLFKRLVLLLAE
jgi:hypothetical protein